MVPSSFKQNLLYTNNGENLNTRSYNKVNLPNHTNATTGRDKAEMTVITVMTKSIYQL